LIDPAEAVIGQAPEPSMSGRINSIIIRYGDIISREVPAMTEAEWSFLVDILNGTWLLAEFATTDPARYLWAEVADADPETAQKWGIDQRALVERLRAMPYSAHCAIAEVVTRFWAAKEQNGSLADQLRAAGARIRIA